MNDDRVAHQQLVTTIREKCRTCYTCVRECPAKAIQILDGQASVIQTRCIGCGNCVTVCSQNAKQVLSGIEDTERVLAGPAPVAAIVAPSYPAEFTDCETSTLVAALRELGFTYVHEVGFGADLVAAEYTRLLDKDSKRYVATTCPAVVSYTRKYHPDLLDRLAPIVSPMLAVARVLHAKYGPERKSRLHRPVHRQEGRGAVRAVRGRGRRRAHVRGAARPARDPWHQPGRAARRPTTTSTRRTAASGPSSPSRAACCRPPTSTKTC